MAAKGLCCESFVGEAIDGWDGVGDESPTAESQCVHRSLEEI
jgi:hypothetical protein